MNFLIVLKEQRTQKIDAMAAIIEVAEKEDRDLTEEEQKKYDAFDTEQKALQIRIERAEQQTVLNTQLEQKPDPIAGKQISEQSPQIPGPEAKKEFESFSHFLYAAMYQPNDQRLEIEKAEKPGKINIRIPEIYSKRFKFGIQSDLEMGTGALGGFAVPGQQMGMLPVIPAASALIRPRATVIPAGSPPDAKVTMPALDQSTDRNIYGGVTVEWTGEGATKPKTDMKLRQIELEPREVSAHIVVSDKLLRNWQAAGAVIDAQFRGAIVNAEELSFIEGAGGYQPLGFLNSQNKSLIKVARKTANDIEYDDVVNMQARALLNRGRTGSLVWLYNQTILPRLNKLADASGKLIWTNNVGNQVTGDIPGALLGIPAINHERSPALGSLGDLVLVDLSFYLIKDGSGIFVQSSEHVYFTKNQTVIKTFWNVDGQPWLTTPVPVVKGNTLSPFIALDA
jgi:HK97 family phage major capsid protein